MELELVAYAIKKTVEGQSSAKFLATYGPEDSKCFSQARGNNYHKFIVFTQRITVGQTSVSTPVVGDLYLYYRNRVTLNGDSPVFSSCECGYFSGGKFISLFKHHITDDTGITLSDPDFAKLVATSILTILNGGK